MAAEEEFQESDVIFPDATLNGGAPLPSDELIDRRRFLSKTVRSVPVNIPLHQRSTIVFDYGGDLDEDREIVPPHVILERRIAAKSAFSVCTGNGRTLKGRNLSQVRNSILRLTGFLEV